MGNVRILFYICSTISPPTKDKLALPYSVRPLPYFAGACPRSARYSLLPHPHRP